MAQKLETYADIVSAIREAIGVQAADTTAINKIKRLVNMYYLDEVVPFKRWTWLQKTYTTVHKAAYGAGTASLTPESTTVTLSVAPNVTLGSFKGYKFSVVGSNKVYTIASHTAEATSLVLEGPYQEALNATANYKIWRDRVDLPSDAKETIEVTHAESTKTCTGIGIQELRKYETNNPKAEGFPAFTNTTDFYDPSVSDGEFESDRYRQLRLYPAITATPVTLNIDYVQEAVELEDDADEPAMPVGDRIVLYYGAGAQAWSLINRNETMGDRWQMKADLKLSRMAGDVDEGYDTPSLSPKSGYIGAIRRSGLRRRAGATAAHGGQSSVALPSYLANVTINGANVTGNITVVDGILIDGRDISEDGDSLDALANTETLTLVDNTTNGVVAVWELAETDTAHIQFSVKRDGVYRAGNIALVSDGVNTAISVASAETDDTGVTFTADVSGSTMRLLYTTTSTGDDATIRYRRFIWLT